FTSFIYYRSFFLLMLWRPPRSPLFPYTTLFRSYGLAAERERRHATVATRLVLIGVLGPQHGGVGTATERRHQRVSQRDGDVGGEDRKSTRLNSSHVAISYAVFCLKKKKKQETEG